MKRYIENTLWMMLALLAVVACHDDQDPATVQQSAKSVPMTFLVTHPGQTRATATSFEENDRIGVYVTAANAPLELGGNFVNNEALTFDGNKWTGSRTLYWDEGTYNVYAYYPYEKVVSSVSDFPFSVRTDQSTQRHAASLDGYEASDLLFACSKGLSASSSPVSLTFRHIMSKIKIRLVKGEDFEGDMPTTAEVYIHNTVPAATVDLQAGVVTRSIKGASKTIVAHKDDDYVYSAIIVPQRIDNRQPLVEVVMKGVSYLFESRFVFKPGMEHLVNLIISDNPDRVKIDIGGEVENWK